MSPGVPAADQADAGWAAVADAFRTLGPRALTPGKLARASGLAVADLRALVALHRHNTLADEVLVHRVRGAVQSLVDGTAGLDEVAVGHGFADTAALDRALERVNGLTATEVRALPGRQTFHMRLPAGLPLDQCLAYLGRDPQSNNMRRTGPGQFVCGTLLDGRAATLTVTVTSTSPPTAQVRIDMQGRTPERAALAAAEVAGRLLGIGSAARALKTRSRNEPHIKRLIRRQPGLSVQQTAHPLDALIWAVLGQQISLQAAYNLLRALTDAAGKRCPGGLRTLPLPERLVEMSLDELGACKLSRAKSRTIAGVAETVMAGTLDVPGLGTGSAPAAHARLVAQHGIGPWTANYVMMRGLGYADCAPLGDAGLRRALVRFYGLDAPPSDAEMDHLMAPFSPHRAVATFHLWRSFDKALDKASGATP